MSYSNFPGEYVHEITVKSDVIGMHFKSLKISIKMVFHGLVLLNK